MPANNRQISAAATAVQQLMVGEDVTVQHELDGLRDTDAGDWARLMLSLNPAWGGKMNTPPCSAVDGSSCATAPAPAPSLSPLLNFRRAQQLAARHGVIIVTARLLSSGRLVGMGQLAIHYKQCETVGFIDDVVVSEGYRRRGIGRAMVAALLAAGRHACEEEEEFDCNDVGCVEDGGAVKHSSVPSSPSPSPSLLPLPSSPFALRYVTLSTNKAGAKELYEAMGFTAVTSNMTTFYSLQRAAFDGAIAMGRGGPCTTSAADH